MTQSRTHTCGELRSTDEGREVTLCGWVENVREVGGNLSFIILRDFYGITQLVAETEDMVSAFKNITKESTVSIRSLRLSWTCFLGIRSIWSLIRRRRA